jgi:hypothetical protein
MRRTHAPRVPPCRGTVASPAWKDRRLKPGEIDREGPIDRLIELGATFARSVRGSLAEAKLLERADRFRVETGPGTDFARWHRLAQAMWRIADGCFTALESNPPNWDVATFLFDDEEVRAIKRFAERLKASPGPSPTIAGWETEQSCPGTNSLWSDHNGIPLHLPILIRRLEGLHSRLLPATEQGTPTTDIEVLWKQLEDGDTSGLGVAIAELNRMLTRFDHEHLRGSYLLRRCVLPPAERRKHFYDLRYDLGVDFGDNIRVMAEAAEELAKGRPARTDRKLKPGYLGPDKVEPRSSNFSLAGYLKGTKEQLVAALHKAGIATSCKNEQLDNLAAQSYISLKGQGKTWRMWLNSQSDFKKVAKHFTGEIVEKPRTSNG